MYTDLQGKTAIVTGAGKKTGIGYAIARKMAECGANIAIADLGKACQEEGQVSTAGSDEMEEIAKQLAADYSVLCRAVAVDVSNTRSVAEMADFVAEQFGAVHVLCNNAGASFGVPSDVEHYDESAWMKTIDINLHGVFRVSKAVIPVMKKNGGGCIINTASRAGKVPPLFNSAYAAAKAGVIMLTKTMAKELSGAGIRVNAVCPGQIMTDIEKWRFGLEAQFFNTTPEAREQEMCQSIPLGRIGDPAEVGELAAFLASDASSYITGQAVNVTGGQLMEL
ncbi:MAG: SDR family oxidoreductase [Desulfobacterales bacterium]|nr:SDR family oxidoreductase [Desulfobacterales bacterium]MBS3754354.1 SDR family oxidoreductase [Desulfobacterales bacterium]